MRLPISPLPLVVKYCLELTSSNSYLKLVRLPLSTRALFIPRIDCGLLFHYDPACLNVFVSRVVQPGLPEFGTLLAHIWPRGAQADALEDLINLFGSINLDWSHPPGSNRRPADYESAALPTELGWPVFN